MGCVYQGVVLDTEGIKQLSSASEERLYFVWRQESWDLEVTERTVMTSEDHSRSSSRVLTHPGGTSSGAGVNSR